MSTSETDEYKIGTCPCGEGSIVKTIVTQDNPWSGVDVTYHVGCNRCRADWELNRSGDQLTLRSSLVPSAQAAKVLGQARQNLEAYLGDLAAAYFAAQGFRTKKAERDHLVELGIVNGSYRTYLQDRKNSPMHQVAYLSRNPTFVATLVRTYGDELRNDDLCKAIADAEAAYTTAALKIVRRSVKL